jgi:hypothetical protein
MSIPLLFGPYGSGALAHAARFREFGANAVWFHGFDPQAFESCARYGVAACVEFKTFRADFSARPELVPTGVDGKPIRYGALVQGVCLSKKDFLDETEAHLLEGIDQFQPAGIWLDYLTYAGWFETPEPDLQESCFCPDCIAEFCNATGIDADTPDAILHSAQADWTRRKCERVASFAARYAALIREKLPECAVGAYMCPWTPGEFNGALRRIFAQDYDLLAPAIDIFTPLIYVKKSGRTSAWGRQFLEQSASFVPSNRKVQLILDALDFPDSLLAAVEASPPGWGLQLFGGERVFSDLDQARVFRQAVLQVQARLDEQAQAKDSL